MEDAPKRRHQSKMNPEKHETYLSLKVSDDHFDDEVYAEEDIDDEEDKVEAHIWMVLLDWLIVHLNTHTHTQFIELAC